MRQSDMKVIRQYCPQAPPLGAKVRIYLGVTRTEGRAHHCAVRGNQDKPRKAIVIGYRLEFGQSTSAWPRGPETINLLVTVKLDKGIQGIPLLSGRVHTAHVSCLECVP